jgi:small conductance mechanosensitive channel
MWTLVALALCINTPGAASAEDPEHALAAEGRALAESLRASRDRRDVLQEQAAGASGAPREVLEEQMWQATQEIGRILHAIAGNLVEREEAGLDTKNARTALEDEIHSSWPTTLERLAERAARLDELVAKRDAAPPEERLQIESDITEFTRGTLRTYTMMVDAVLALEEAKLDLGDQRAFLVEHLTQHAEYLAASARVAFRERDETRAELELTPDDSGLKAESAAAQRWAERATANLTEVATLMERLGLETTPYRQLLFEATGEITAGVMDRKVALGLVSRWRSKLGDALVEHGPRWLLKALVFLAILLAFRVLTGATRRVVSRSLAPARVQVSQLLRDSLISWSSRAVMLLGVLIAVSQLGIEIGPMLAGLGIAGFILGFAMQDSLSNFAAGGMILVYRPFDVDDLIEAAGVRGTVKRMTLVSTTILTLDNQTLIVPNSKIWGDVIRNVTAQKIRRVDLVFGISYESDVDHADAVLRGILEKNPRVLADPEPRVEVHALNESSVDFVVRPWVQTEDYWEAYWEITREVKKRFDAEGISIPYPQRDVHLRVPATANSREGGGAPA